MADPVHILLVRLGAFGDVLHALPTAASMKRSIPGATITWAIDPRWQWLLDGNPDVDTVLPVNRHSRESLREAWRFFRERPVDIAVDVQGLIKSGLLVRAAHAKRRIGFAASHLRERAAGLFYTERTAPRLAHVVEWNLDLAQSAGATERVIDFPVPPGKPEGSLPKEPFVLASPFAGWAAKQWPLEYYEALGALLRETGHALVLNVVQPVDSPVTQHVSGIPGLIDATRRAAAIIGLDSGPLHLAAALRKPGVALFGPTDPARNGPYGGTIHTLRDPAAPTTYRRMNEILPCMRALTPRIVLERLLPCLTTASPNPTPTR
ncbi:MAG: glycosyltransferase family 9 protein [Acidobacteria bacterium]|nr:glycosyltransferase family 9 protein [Acidobacteriota bacterium]